MSPTNPPRSSDVRVLVTFPSEYESRMLEPLYPTKPPICNATVSSLPSILTEPVENAFWIVVLLYPTKPPIAFGICPVPMTLPSAYELVIFEDAEPASPPV